MRVSELIAVFLQTFVIADCAHVAIINGAKGRWRFSSTRSKSKAESEEEPFYVSFNDRSQSYGAAFGKNRLPLGTHIYNVDFKNHKDENKPFLTESMYKNQKDDELKSELRGWSEKFERRWRKTTKMPYFANELPSENAILPAAVVVGKSTVHVVS
jgi:hypothetical protein